MAAHSTKRRREEVEVLPPEMKEEKWKLGSDDFEDFRALCSSPLAAERVFDMQDLRAIMRRLVRQKKITTLPLADVPNKSRKELCTVLSDKLGGNVHTSFPIFTKENIPYETILAANIEDQGLNIPSWAWENTELGWMLKPYTASSGRSYSLNTLQRIPSPKKDVSTRELITDEFHENWNLRMAIEDWIFEHTGFTVKELLALKVQEFLASGLALEEKKEYKLAREKYLQALEIEPKNAAALISYLNNLTQDEEKDKDYKELAEVATRLTKERPGNIQVWILLSRVLNRLGKTEQALTSVDEAIRLMRTTGVSRLLFSEMLQMLQMRVKLLDKLTRHDDALVAFDELLDFAKEDKDFFLNALRERIQVYLHMDRDKNALKYLTIVIDSGHGTAEEYSKRWRILMRLGRMEEALVDANHLVEMAPDSSDARYTRALSLYELKRYEKSLIDLNYVLSPSVVLSSSTYVDRSRELRSDVLHELKRYEEEVKDLLFLLSEHPTAKVRLRLARLFYNLGRDQEAYEQFYAIRDALHDDYQILREYAQSAYYTKNYQDALRVYNKLMALHNSTAVPLSDQARDYYRRSRLGREAGFAKILAKVDLEEAARLDPGNPTYREELDKFLKQSSSRRK